MRVTWSLWTKPLTHGARSGWSTPFHDYLGWVYSVLSARAWAPRSCLHADSLGAALLTEELELPFDEVNTELDALAHEDPRRWCIGKLHAYAAQQAPFIHLDSDVFMSKPPPASVASARVIAQQPEWFTLGASFYTPERLLETMLRATHGWLPKEWVWFVNSGRPQRGECCGIFGGTDLPFIRAYAKNALATLTDRRNREAWRRLGDPVPLMILPEQYYLSACIEYRRQHTPSNRDGSDLSYMLPPDADEAAVQQSGFTHLIGHYKRDPELMKRLERRTLERFPEHYRRAQQLAERQPWPVPPGRGLPRAGSDPRRREAAVG